MYECDFCLKIKPESQMHEITRSGPPYYDYFCICKECHNKIMEAENGRKEDNSHHQQSE